MLCCPRNLLNTRVVGGGLVGVSSWESNHAGSTSAAVLGCGIGMGDGGDHRSHRNGEML